MSDDDPEIDVAAKFREYADKSGYAWGTKGIPGEHKELEEIDVAKAVLDSLKLEYCEPVPGPNDTPDGQKHPPDVATALRDGARLGIEVKELVSEEMRALVGQRRKAERKLGLTQLDAFRAELDGKNPTPNHVSRWAYAAWDATSVAARLDEIISKVEKQLEGYTAGFNEIWLAIFTDEVTLHDESGKEVVRAAAVMLTSRRNHLKRVFVRLGYVPDPRDLDNGHYPVVEI